MNTTLLGFSPELPALSVEIPGVLETEPGEDGIWIGEVGWQGGWQGCDAIESIFESSFFSSSGTALEIGTLMLATTAHWLPPS